MGATTRLALPYPELADAAIVPDDVRELALSLDRAAIIDQGAIASRPVSSPAQPGIRGRFYWATDELILYHDNGTGWTAINPALVTDGPAGEGTLRTLGTGAQQATAGNDTRLSDQRVPTDGSVTAAKVAAGLKPSQGAGATVEALRAIGTGAGQVAAGNDARFPAGADIVNADVSTTAAIAESKLALASDAAAGTPSRRTLGTGAQQATAGNDTRLSDQRAPRSPEAGLGVIRGGVNANATVAWGSGFSVYRTGGVGSEPGRYRVDFSPNFLSTPSVAVIEIDSGTSAIKVRTVAVNTDYCDIEVWTMIDSGGSTALGSRVDRAVMFIAVGPLAA